MFSMLKKKNVLIFCNLFYVSFFMSKAHLCTVTWICILRTKFKWWPHNLTLLFNLCTLLSLTTSKDNIVNRLMLWFGPGNFVYKYANQSSKYTNGTFHPKSPNVPDEFFYLSITVERLTVYTLVVLYLWLHPILQTRVKVGEQMHCASSVK